MNRNAPKYPLLNIVSAVWMIIPVAIIIYGALFSANQDPTASTAKILFLYFLSLPFLVTVITLEACAREDHNCIIMIAWLSFIPPAIIPLLIITKMITGDYFGFLDIKNHFPSLLISSIMPFATWLTVHSAYHIDKLCATGHYSYFTGIISCFRVMLFNRYNIIILSLLSISIFLHWLPSSFIFR
jgi:hypothetical protein